MRILGLDYGSKTVGVALSDATCLIAQPLETIERKQENKLRQTYARIEALVVEHDVDKIVLGLPKMMNNTEGPRVQATREFAENLERRTGLPIIFEDERLTTVEANRILEETGVCVSGRKHERRTGSSTYHRLSGDDPFGLRIRRIGKWYLPR